MRWKFSALGQIQRSKKDMDFNTAIRKYTPVIVIAQQMLCQSLQSAKRLRLILITSVCLVVLGCSDTTNNDDPIGVADPMTAPSNTSHLSAQLQVDWPSQTSYANAAAAMFSHGNAVNLIAGDLFRADSQLDNVLLRSKELGTGRYFGRLDLLADDSAQTVSVEVVHEPLAARSERWYPAEEFNLDPGAGEFVGVYALIDFPPEITLLTLPSGNTFTSRSDDVEISWQALSGTETMRIVGRVECFDNGSSIAYGVSRFLGEDDGYSRFSIGELIIEDETGAFLGEFFSNLASAMISAMLEVVTLGLIDADDLFDTGPFIIDYCDLDLALFRERLGMLDGYEEGWAIGSRSTRINLRYEAY